MKSITTTFHRSYNYGATLQAYALQRCLIKIGFDNEVLDFPRDPYEKPALLSKNIKLAVARFVIRISEALHKKEKRELIESFDRFSEEHLKLTKRYSSISELDSDVLSADVFITGSDQIFDLEGTEYTVNRNMLSFVPKDGLKYSYAASLANYKLNEEEKKRFERYLSDFHTISVRETEARMYLSSFANGNYRVDIDPVLLVAAEEWQEIAKPPQCNGDYILYFQVNSNPMAKEVLKYLRNKYKCKVVCLQTNSFVRVHADKVVLNASPEEFIGWFLNASHVVTTSFHGTAFSVLFQKDFFTLTKRDSNPVRMKNLLNMFGLEDRLISGIGEIDILKPIEWDEVMKRLSCKKNESLKYLNDIYAETCRRKLK